ncbi:unnamed protein product [Brassicogethes aeneus]|uniref:Bromo domain-containing protein n=1 Tax=Brassicogethes aeneus TaxID=1431903 RepID=A0A9P0B1J5_BRAAE|nr:unnamed protein product [Brassicogethes aeneus]
MDKTDKQRLAQTADLYFLIKKFLTAGPLKKTLQVLNEELEEHRILPKRMDWEGNEHERTVEDMERQFPHIKPDFLLQLACQATNTYGTSIDKSSITSLLSAKFKDISNIKNLNNFRQYQKYVSRYHGVPVHDIKLSFNILNGLRGREISGPFSRQRTINPSLYSAMQIQRTTLGHLSAVYCLLFDYSGKFIITGADDLLIKLWSANTGRLIAAFRGASSEITDIAINLENNMLAAGSIDRVLRVWNLQSGAPIAVLTGHTGSITSVNFCPTACWGVRYLISTSSDGSIAFWTYEHENGKVNFRNTPIMYQEKIRPGQAQMICSSFSPGGTFLATGSADHHVRVYYMKGDEGPIRIVETEAHTDRVDSIQWAHSGLKFLSGSKDGTAIIWMFERQQWKTVCLNMTMKLSTCKKSSEDCSKKLKVTMVAWNLYDDWVITAVSDYSLKVWSLNGELVKVLTGHTDEIYVVESHPHDTNVFLSAGHDGQLFVWDINKGEIVFRFFNSIESQGYGAIFDAKWSPDGHVFSASDSHGHILTFGFGNGSTFFEQLPKELFFHTDYRPLVRDANHYVLDEQTQVPPHLMPPPFLVDIDGNPYPPMLQRLVPGRENCRTEQLVPNIVIGNEGTQEVIQDFEIPPQVLANEEENRGNVSALRLVRRSRDMERLRNSTTGDWQSDPNIEWKRNILIPPLRPALMQKFKHYRECMKDNEVEEYQKQLKLRPHMISTGTSSNIKSADKKKNKKYPVRTNRSEQPVEEPGPPEPVTSSDNDEDSECSGYSDWMAEEGVNLEPPKRSKRRQIHVSISDKDNDNDDDDDDDRESLRLPSTSTGTGTRKRRAREAKENHKLNRGDDEEDDFESEPPRPSTSTSVPKISKKTTEQYRLSEWLSETIPRKSPYYPQMGDEIVYFIEGHQLYLNAVRNKNAYEINTKDLPWNKMPIRDHEFVKVIGIQYEIKPPRLCCLRLALLDEEARMTGKIFTVKYHDMPDVLDFFVLKQTYCTAISRNWTIGDKFRCMIDDGWWIGEIIDKSPASDLFPNSSFLCYGIKWQNGEQERMSPWDFEPIDDNRMPTNENEALPVMQEELDAILYKHVPEDWSNNDQDEVCKYILDGLTKVMQLAIAEPFLVPVDLSIYPTYAMIIEYPIDLSTIKARFENNFYRRLTAAQFDIRYLATNAEKFNERHSVIVKRARILTELCLRIVKNCTGYVDVQTIYHQLVDTYDSSDTEDEVEITPSSSRTLRSLPNRTLKDSGDWKNEAKNLIDAVWEAEDSIPFRTPVNLLKYPDYKQVIKNPMDLGTVKDNFLNDRYNIPQEFSKDMKLIFQNSRTYNTNKRSRIYVMTVRLAAIFEEHMSKIIENWKIAKKREKLETDLNTGDESSSSSSGSSKSVKSENLPLMRGRKKIDTSGEGSESEDVPLESLKTASRNQTETDSTSTSQEPVAGPYQEEKGEEAPVDIEGHSSNASEDEYKPEAPAPRRKRYRSSSEEEEEEEEFIQEEESSESDTYTRRKRTVRKRPVRKKPNNQSSDDYEDDSDASVEANHRSKRQRKPTSSEDDSDSDTADSDSDDEKPLRTVRKNKTNGYFSTVSSRGRVRKLTPRAIALMKK